MAGSLDVGTMEEVTDEGAVVREENTDLWVRAMTC